MSFAEFLKINFFNNFLRNTIIESHSLDPDQALCFVDPDQCPSCWQKLSADDTSSMGESFQD